MYNTFDMHNTELEGCVKLTDSVTEGRDGARYL